MWSYQFEGLHAQIILFFFFVSRFVSSILYADIVNFTKLANELEPSDLVRALNELFGRFDELAKVR